MLIPLNCLENAGENLHNTLLLKSLNVYWKKTSNIKYTPDIIYMKVIAWKAWSECETQIMWPRLLEHVCMKKYQMYISYILLKALDCLQLLRNLKYAVMCLCMTITLENVAFCQGYSFEFHLKIIIFVVTFYMYIPMCDGR